jgi:hypothetical protein
MTPLYHRGGITYEERHGTTMTARRALDMPTDGLEYLRSTRSSTLKYLEGSGQSLPCALQDMKSIGYLEQFPTKFSSRVPTALLSATFATSGIQQ